MHEGAGDVPGSTVQDAKGNGEASTYASALRDRLLRIRSELEAQGAHALDLRQKVMSTRRDAEINGQELIKLRATWAAEQPRRDTLLSEMGDAERNIAERERRCAVAWAAQVAAQGNAPGGIPVMASSSSDASLHRPGNTMRNALAADGREREREQRQKVASLDDNRSKLLTAAEELREATNQENQEAAQLRRRNETLRKECTAMKTAVEAAKESCERQQGRFDAVDVTLSAGQPRILGLERHVAELQQEVQTLRGQFTEASKEATGKAEKPRPPPLDSFSTAEAGTARSTPLQKAAVVEPGSDLKVMASAPASDAACSAVGKDEDAAWAINRRLQAKVMASAPASDAACSAWAINRRLQAKVTALRGQVRSKQQAAKGQNSPEKAENLGSEIPCSASREPD